MFARPRAKKGVPLPPSKKRKTTHAVEEISFDDNARADYLTGFRKRKQARVKHAQEIAAEKARLDRIEMRKQLREDRKQAVEEHVQAVNKILQGVDQAGAGELDAQPTSEGEVWEGIPDEDHQEPLVDLEEQYIDEDRFTTVTVETVTVDKEGLHKPEPTGTENSGEEEEAEGDANHQGSGAVPEQESSKPLRERPKKKKKKFRYETKFERQSKGGKKTRGRR